MVKASRIRVGERYIGDDSPCFIIAEAGVNHNGNIELARKLVAKAQEAGADAIKFQTFEAESLVTKNAKKAKYQMETTSTAETQYEMIKKLELSKDDFRELSMCAKSRSIVFLSSPFDEVSVDLLDELDVPAFKIASGEITNIPLLKHIAGKKRPIIMSTGMATVEEIGYAIEAIRQQRANDIVLLHCVTSYPAKMEDINLRVIQTLKNKFNLPVGFSDHTLGINAPIAAVALGACVIEKHFTIDKNLPGPDHKASLEPTELSEMVRAIRDVEKALGDGVKKLSKDEEEIKRIARKSIVAKATIRKGERITREKLEVKRPSTGIESKYIDAIVGKIAKKQIEEDEVLEWEAVE